MCETDLEKVNAGANLIILRHTAPYTITHAFCDSNSIRFRNRVCMTAMHINVTVVWGCAEIFPIFSPY